MAKNLIYLEKLGKYQKKKKIVVKRRSIDPGVGTAKESTVKQLCRSLKAQK